MTSLKEQLLAVREQYGALTPENVLQAARPADSPLHSRFEWDDSVAADEYRKVQARDLIRSVRVRYQLPGREPTSVRAFVSVPRDPKPVYEPAEEVAQDDFARKIVLQAMRREWEALKAKYGDFSEFFELVKADLEAA